MNSIASLPLQSEPGMNVAVVTSVIAYESMCRSIDTCQDHAECKDIFDKAAALKEYARRIKNTEAERRASNVRLIAERRYGQLIAKLARATPAEAGKASGEARSNVPRDGDRSGKVRIVRT